MSDSDGYPTKYRLSELIDGHGTPCPYEYPIVIEHV